MSEWKCPVCERLCTTTPRTYAVICPNCHMFITREMVGEVVENKDELTLRFLGDGWTPKGDKE